MGMGATKSLVPYWMRALMIQASLPSLFTLTMVYLSSFSGVSLPSLIPHQRPAKVALVRVVLNFVSSSSWVSLGLADADAGAAGVSEVAGLGASCPDARWPAPGPRL